VREIQPGNIWATGGSYKKIKDAGHLQNSYGYVRTRQEPGTIVWSHKPDEDWINDISMGVIMMAPGKKHQRIYLSPQAGV